MSCAVVHLTKPRWQRFSEKAPLPLQINPISRKTVWASHLPEMPLLLSDVQICLAIAQFRCLNYAPRANQNSKGLAFGPATRKKKKLHNRNKQLGRFGIVSRNKFHRWE